jgi:hypothetical protein
MMASAWQRWLADPDLWWVALSIGVTLVALVRWFRMAGDDWLCSRLEEQRPVDRPLQ